MPARLSGIRVVSFFPWKSFESSGAWSRFSCLWRFLIEEGAVVTLAFFEKEKPVTLTDVALRFLGDYTVFHDGRTLAQTIDEAQKDPELKSYTRQEIFFLSMYRKDLYLRCPGVTPWLDDLICSHDIVTCEYPMYAPLLSDFCRKHQRPLIVTSHDALYELHSSNPKPKQALKQKELHALGLADALVFCNDNERQALATHGLKGATVMNTGDVLSITPGNEAACREAIRAKFKLKTPHYCLFVGSSHGPNLEAAVEVKRLAKAMPELTFILAGECHIKAEEGNFLALGFVTEQLLDSLHRGAFAVLLPLTRGGGMAVKLFHAFTYAKAVISTPIGARGHSVCDGRELLIAQTPAQFPAALRRLLADESLRSALGAAARAYAEPLDFRNHFQPYADIIINLLKRPASTQPKRDAALILVDNNLTDHIGHHFNYARVLRDHCTAKGHAWSALVKKSATRDVLAALDAHATFTQGIHEESPLNPFPPEWGPIRGTYDFLLSNDQFAQELQHGLARCARLGDTIFLPNATHRQLIGLALLLKKHPLFLSLKYVVLLRFSVLVATGPLADRKNLLDKDAAEKYAMAINLLHSIDQAGAVRFTTDSTELAKEFGNFSKRPIEVLPIPHTTHTASNTSLASEIPAKKPGARRVIFLGDARDEKGFEFLPAVVRACVQNPALPPTEFVFQAYISSHWHNRMQATIDELAALNLPQLHLVRQALSTEAYQTLLHSADLVLIPYDAATYRARTSGPFIEALCADKPVVAPRNSWMSLQLGTSSAGVTFTSGQAPDLARAVQAALANLPAHTAAAAELGAHLRAYHNPANFIQHLLAPTAAPAPSVGTHSPLAVA